MRFLPRNRKPAIFGGLLVVALTSVQACSTDDPWSPEVVSLQPIAQVDGIPASRTHSLTLLDGHRACFVDSYRTQVLCRSPNEETVIRIGGEGDGPGEFRAPALLIRGPEQRLGVIDYGLRRLSIFDSAGSLLSTHPVPHLFQPLAAFTDSMVIGLFERYSDEIRTAPIAWVSLTSDSVVHQAVFHHQSEATRRLGFGAAMNSGVVNSTGNFVFWVDRYTLARYDGDGRFLEEFTSPLYSPEEPTQRDLDQFIEGARYIFGHRPSERHVNEFRSRPRVPLIPSRPLRFDSSGRLWVATTRDREEFSYFDVFRSTDLISQVQVRDRILTYDIQDTVLAVLAERPYRDGTGEYVVGIDWYRIPEIRK